MKTIDYREEYLTERDRRQELSAINDQLLDALKEATAALERSPSAKAKAPNTLTRIAAYRTLIAKAEQQ